MIENVLCWGSGLAAGSLMPGGIRRGRRSDVGEAMAMYQRTFGLSLSITSARSLRGGGRFKG